MQRPLAVTRHCKAMGVRQFAACNRIRISYKITYLGTRNLVSVSDNQRGAARAVNTQSALGVVAFVASVILHHAMPPSDMRQLASSQSISIVSPIEVVKLTITAHDSA